MVFIFQFVNMVYHIDWLAYIEEFLHSWNKPNLIMVYELFHVLLNSVCKTFVEDFFSYVHQWYWPVVFFLLCYLCLVLVSAWWWPHRMSLEMFLLMQFLESFRSIGISSSPNAWQNSPVKPSGHGLLFWRDFLFYHSFNFSACNWVVHNFCFFLVQSWKIELF